MEIKLVYVLRGSRGPIHWLLFVHVLTFVFILSLHFYNSLTRESSLSFSRCGLADGGSEPCPGARSKRVDRLKLNVCFPASQVGARTLTAMQRSPGFCSPGRRGGLDVQPRLLSSPLRTRLHLPGRHRRGTDAHCMPDTGQLSWDQTPC